MCPFQSDTPNCVNGGRFGPIGICSVRDGDDCFVTCPIRFQQGWRVVEDAANYFFGHDANWTTIRRFPLTGDPDDRDSMGAEFGLVALDPNGLIVDFGALELRPLRLESGIEDDLREGLQDDGRYDTESLQRTMWLLSESLDDTRKRLGRMLLQKGEPLRRRHKRMALAIDASLWGCLADVKSVQKETSDIAWMIYDLQDTTSSGCELSLRQIQYSRYEDAFRQLRP